MRGRGTSAFFWFSFFFIVFFPPLLSSHPAVSNVISCHPPPSLRFNIPQWYHQISNETSFQRTNRTFSFSSLRPLLPPQIRCLVSVPAFSHILAQYCSGLHQAASDPFLQDPVRTQLTSRLCRRELLILPARYTCSIVSFPLLPCNGLPFASQTIRMFFPIPFFK